MRLFYLCQRKKDGPWYVAFRDPVTGAIGTKKSTKTLDKRKAENIAMNWLRDGVPNVLKPVKISFYEYLKDFWNYDSSPYFKERTTLGKDVNRRYAKDMQGIVNRYYRDYFGDKRLSQITEENLQDFLSYLRATKGLSAATVNKTRGTGITALRYAKRKRLIRDFNFDGVIRASGRIKERGILEREEVEDLFNQEWPDPRARMINLIASQTAMRMGEIQALRFCDIHETYIDVIHSWSKIDGGLKSTKTDEKRKIPILPELYKELMEYIGKHKRMYRQDVLLFPGAIEEIPYHCHQINAMFHRALNTIGIDEEQRKARNIVFHSWRHYCAKNLAQVTTRTTAMAILGHKTGGIFDHYARHVDSEIFSKMAQAISDGLKLGQSEEIAH